MPVPDFSTSGGGGIVSELGRQLLLTWSEGDEETGSGNEKSVFERRKRAQEKILEEGERERGRKGGRRESERGNKKWQIL